MKNQKQISTLFHRMVVAKVLMLGAAGGLPSAQAEDAYSSHPRPSILNGLAGHFSFDEGRLMMTASGSSIPHGVVNDAGTQTLGNTVAVVGPMMTYWEKPEVTHAATGTLGTVSSVPGQMGEAAKFSLSGSNAGSIVASNAAFANTGTSSFALSFWFKATAYPSVADSGSTLAFLICKGNANSNSDGYSVRLFSPSGTSTGNQLRLSFKTSGTSEVSHNYGLATLNLNTWYHVAANFDRTAAQTSLYVDGTKIGGSPSIPAYVGSLDSTQPLYLGRAHTSATAAYFNGAIDDLGLWNRTLSADDITFLHNRGVTHHNLQEPDMFYTGTGAYTSVDHPIPAPPPAAPQTKNVVTDFGAVGTGTSTPIGSGTSAARTLVTNYMNMLISGTTSFSPTDAVQPTDEKDWVAIQAALIYTGTRGGGTVVIPEGHTFVINRHLWIYSNTTLEWKNDTDNASFVHLNKKTNVGTAIGNAVSGTAGGAYKPLYRSPVQNITIINPHLDMDGIVGENGISFANGAENITITGGHIKNALWGTSLDTPPDAYNFQGGRAFQFEAGVKNIVVDGTLITDSTIGFSTTASNPNTVDGSGNYDPRRGHFNVAYDIAWGITGRNLKIVNTDLPILLSNNIYAKTDEDGLFNGHYVEKNYIQRATIINAEIINSGLQSILVRSGTAPNTENPSQSGVIGMIGGQNLSIQGIKHRNESSYAKTLNGTTSSKIGGLIKGFGANVHIDKVEYEEGDALRYFDIGSNVAGTAYNYQRSRGMYVSNFAVTGTNAKADLGLKAAWLTGGRFNALYGTFNISGTRAFLSNNSYPYLSSGTASGQKQTILIQSGTVGNPNVFNNTLEFYCP